VGRVCKTDFRRTSLEAMLRGLKVQLLILLEMERRRLSEEMDLEAAPVRGMPIQLDGRELKGIPRSLEI